MNEWYPTGKFIRVDTYFRTDFAYKKELMAALPLTGHASLNTEMEYNGKFGHTLGRIQHISLMSIMYIYYATYHLTTQTVSPTLPGFQCTKWCVQYLSSQPHKHIFYPSKYYDRLNVIGIICSGNRDEDHTTQNF